MMPREREESIGGEEEEDGVDGIERAMMVMKAPPPSGFLEAIHVLIPFLTGRN